MVSETYFSSSYKPSTRIFSDVAGDITIVVDGDPFLLHKFPLVSRSGKIRKMVANKPKESDISKLELQNFPGGPHTFELAMKFCYNMNFEITPSNVAQIRCAAEFLEMTEDYRQNNLVERTEIYLTEVVFQSLENSIQVLSTCELLPLIAEEVGISTRCIEAIAINACKEQLVSAELTTGACVEWWVEDLSVLKIEYYQRVICAMRKVGLRSEIIAASLMHYAHNSLKGIGKYQILNPSKPNLGVSKNDQTMIIEVLVGILPAEKDSNIPVSFLFGMLRMAIMLDAAIACRLELERRIAFHLETVLLDDLLMPSIRTGDSLFDVDSVHRIVVGFLQRIEEEEENEDYGYDSEGVGCSSHGLLLKVGRLVDAYLAEIAPDPYLSLQKFTAMVEILPDYARVIDDGLYRAIDIYLKAHPGLSEQDCRKLCKFIDCQKLSQEASNHAAQNERLPVQMTVRILYVEQIRLKNSLSGDTFLSQRMSSGVPSAAMSPRDNYASLRRENRELKLEISRIRVRLSELEKEQMCMKHGMIDKPGNGKTFLTSLSKGIGRIGIFGNPAGGRRQKTSRKSRGSEGKSGRIRRYSMS